MTNWLHLAQDALPQPGHGIAPDALPASQRHLAHLLPSESVKYDPLRHTLIAPMTQEQRDWILHWLKSIKETDPAQIQAVLAQCESNLSERNELIRQAKALPKPYKGFDGRRTCLQCANLSTRRLCLAGERGDMPKNKVVSPLIDQPQRCTGYQPGPFDLDRRSGRERWSPSDPKPIHPEVLRGKNDYENYLQAQQNMTRGASKRR